MTHLAFGRATPARFPLDAPRRGLGLSLPFATAPGYGAIVATGRRLPRVQVKCARLLRLPPFVPKYRGLFQS